MSLFKIALFGLGVLGLCAPDPRVGPAYGTDVNMAPGIRAGQSAVTITFVRWPFT